MELQSFECSTCQICLYGLTNYQRHANSLEHANKVRSKNLVNITDEDNVCSSSNVAAAKQVSTCTEVAESVYKSSSMICTSYLQCELCQKQFTGNDSYQQHLVSAGHKKKLAMSSNQSNPTGLLKCEVCDKYCSGPAPYEQHMISNMHKKKVLGMELKQKSNLFASFLAQPETDSKIDFQSQDYRDDHLESSSQVNNLQGNRTVQNSIGWSCDICDKSFSGHVPYEQHMSSNVHTKKLKERGMLNNMQNKSCTSESLLDNKGNGTSSSHFIGLKCEVCDKSFSGPVPYDQHMNSQVHKKKVQDKDMLKKLLSTDQIDSTSDNEKKTVLYTSDNEKTSDFSNKFCSSYQLLSANQIGLLQFKCEVCDKSFTGRIPFDQHMSSVNHQKKMLQKTQLNSENKNIINGFSINCTPKNEIPASQNWFCQVCDKQCSGSVPFKQHIMSDAHCKKMWLVEVQENLKEMKDFDSAKPTEDASDISIEDNCLNSDDNEMDGMSPETRQINSDLIFGDVLKDLNFITPETLNVTTFKANENIVFDIALK